MKTRRSTLATVTLLTAVALSITGCGGGSSSNRAGGQTPPAGPSGVDPAQIKAIRQRLKAAGLTQSIPVTAERLSGIPSNLPSNLPSGAPTDLPSNFSGGPGGAEAAQAASSTTLRSKQPSRPAAFSSPRPKVAKK